LRRRCEGRRDHTQAQFAPKPAATKPAASGHPALGAQIHQVASDAFIHGFHVGCLVVAAGVAGLGVLLAAVFLPAQPLVLAADLEFNTVEDLFPVDGVAAIVEKEQPTDEFGYVAADFAHRRSRFHLK
jgi:hypothetical protein